MLLLALNNFFENEKYLEQDEEYNSNNEKYLAEEEGENILNDLYEKEEETIFEAENYFEKSESTDEDKLFIDVEDEKSKKMDEYSTEIKDTIKFQKSDYKRESFEIVKNTQKEELFFGSDYDKDIEEHFKSTNLMDCDISCLTCEKSIEFNNSCLECNEKLGYYPIYESNISKCYNNETIMKNYYLDLNSSNYIWKKCYDKCERCESQGNKDNMNCLSCKEKLYSNAKLVNGNCIYECLNNTFITPDGDCVLICPNGTFQFSLNNSCLNSCPQNYEINNNKCIFKSVEDSTRTASEFLNQMRNDITSYVNSSKVIDGKDFKAMITYSDEINPEEQLKNGISAFDLGNCTNVIKEYYNISKDENLILLNMETKTDESKKNESINNDDKSFNLGKFTQLEVFDSSGRKLNLSVCKDEIKIMKYIGDVEQLDIDSAKSLSNQGIDVFNANDDFFNDICHKYDSSDGKDIILNDRRNDIYQNVTFCQDGCTYNGINYNLMAANCLCASNSLQVKEDNKTNNEKDSEVVNFKSVTKSFLENLFSFNFDVLRCYNLAFDKKILVQNIGFYCLSIMFILQIIFFLIYLIKKVKPLKNFMLIFKMNKDKPNDINNKKIIKTKNKSTPPPKSNYSEKKSDYDNQNNKKTEKRKKNIINKENKNQKNKLNNYDDILSEHELRLNKNRNRKNIISKNDSKSISTLLKDEMSDNSSNKLGCSKSNFKKKKSLFSKNITPIINIQNINIQNNLKLINPSEDNQIKRIKEKETKEKIYKIKSNKHVYFNIDNSNKKGNKNNEDIHKMETLTQANSTDIINSKINKGILIRLSKSDSDIQDMDYEEAIIYDKRPFIRMYWGYLIDTQIILGTFCTENNLDLFIIKLSFFVFTFQISFFLNALFYTDKYISDAYHNDGVLDFFSGLPKSIYSFFATLITTNLLRMLSTSKNELMRTIKKSGQYNNYYNIINKRLLILRRKLIIYFIIVFLLETFFLYYVTVFCAVYRYSQKYWFLGCLESFGVDSFVAIIACIFLSLFRYISIKKRIKCFYILASFIGTFL